MFISAEIFRDRLIKNDDVLVINADTEWLTTMVIIKPEEYKNLRLSDISKLSIDEIEKIKEYNTNYAKFILEKGKKGEITFTYTASRSYKIPNTNINIGALKSYPMSVFFNNNIIEDLINEIFDSIEDYKKSIKSVDYTKMSAISDNMVYRK